MCVIPNLTLTWEFVGDGEEPATVQKVEVVVTPLALAEGGVARKVAWR